MCARCDLGRKSRRKLIALLGGACAICASARRLQVDHIDGRDWCVRHEGLRGRVRRYWAEYRAGARLRVLCAPCNNRHRPRPVVKAGEPFDWAAHEAKLEEAPF